MPPILTDNFNDNDIDLAKWDIGAIDNSNAGVTVVETGGQLVITPMASTAGSNYNGLTSDATFDMTQGYAIWKLEQLAGPAANVQVRMGVLLDASNYIGFSISNTSLGSRIRTAAVNSDVSTTYNSTNHKYLMVHICGGTINWYASADGASWTVLRSGVAQTFAVTALKLVMDSGTFASVGSPGNPAIFDDVEIGTLDIEAPFEQVAAFGGFVDLIIDPGFPMNIIPAGGGEAFTIPMSRRYAPPDSPRIFAAVSNLLAMRQTSTGRWKTIDLHCGQNTSATSVIFNVRKNGEAMLAGAGRLIVPNGASSVSRVVDIEATLGDLIELSIEQVPSIGIATPIDINIRTEVS